MSAKKLKKNLKKIKFFCKNLLRICDKYCIIYLPVVESGVKCLEMEQYYLETPNML